MTRMRARAGRAAAVLAAAALLAGCQFAVVPPKKHAAGAGATSGTALRDPFAARRADAPALLTQCLVTESGLRPGSGLDWLRNGQVSINSTNATDFATWWRAHDTPGPYPQTVVIAGHRTHYLEFGTPWVRQGALWAPANTGNGNPKALRYSLIAWVNWAAVHGRLPSEICGPSANAARLQAKVFGTATPNPW
jgi:hypothetical protein